MYGCVGGWMHAWMDGCVHGWMAMGLVDSFEKDCERESLCIIVGGVVAVLLLLIHHRNQYRSMMRVQYVCMTSYLFERGNICQEVQQQVRFSDTSYDCHADHPKNHLGKRRHDENNDTHTKKKDKKLSLGTWRVTIVTDCERQRIRNYCCRHISCVLFVP